MSTAPVRDLSPEELRRRLKVWLLARVLVVTVFLGAFALSHLAQATDPEYPIRSIAALIVAAYAFSVGSAILVARFRRLRRFAFVQVIAEIALISGATLLTGGIHSPMGVWYNLAIIGASFLLRRRGGHLAALLSSLSYGTVVNLSYYQLLPQWLMAEGTAVEPGFGVLYHITANIVSFFSIAFLSSILAERHAAAEQALEESEANFQRIDTLQRTLVQNLESGVVTTDAEGVIRSANQAAERIIGASSTDLVGKMISDVFPVLRPPVGAKRVLDPSPTPIELAHRPKLEVPEQILRCTSFRIGDTYQNPIGALYIFQDITILKVLEARQAETGNAPEAPAEELPPRIDGMLGGSPQMREIAELIEKVAPSDSTVLITGESGTGKEVAARAIHALSHRQGRPMVVVNCAAIPENLIETELFGHTRGAFTGAVSERKGLFRAADGGTIFLDEVGDLPLLLQVKLLRVLQERAFTPVGAQSQVIVDVRIIAATNRDLEADVATGRFREDLFYRLNVIRIRMPSLRERRDDLPVLIEHFLDRFSESLGRSRPRLTPEAMRRLVAYDYPGNIRELENVVQRLVALVEGPVIGEDDVPGNLDNGGLASTRLEIRAESGEPALEAPATVSWMDGGSSNLDAELEAIERKLLDEALRRAGGVRKRAAEILGINYRSLRHRLSKYGYGEFDGRETRD